jgi:hypothetical protein
MHNNIIVRLVTYYVAVIAFMSGLFHVFPILGEYMAAERARQGVRGALELGGASGSEIVTSASSTFQLLDPGTAIPIVLSLVLAVLVALPVVWVYRWTRPRKRYNQAFAHTLLVVPIAITLVVFLAKGSLALAFSLAGIVAAVRFRTSLDDSMDAVYVFIVIGTGLAAGVQLLAVAVIASILFNAVALTVWRMNFGGTPVVINGWRIARPEPEDMRHVTGANGAHDSEGEEHAPHAPFNAQLRLLARDFEQARDFLTPLFEQRVKKWQIAEVTTQQDGTSLVEFDLRLRKSTDLVQFVRAIEQGAPLVSKVELTKLDQHEHH